MGEGLPWKYHFQPHVEPFYLQPNEKRQIPQETKTFSAKEGTLTHMTAAFTSPMGGISMQSVEEVNLDFKTINTIRNETYIGATSPNNVTFVAIPPVTPAGVYVIHSQKEWTWETNARLYVLNSSKTDTIKCLGYGYIMDTMNKDRYRAEEWAFYLTLFPQLKEQLRDKLKSKITSRLQEIGVTMPE